jgi:hypothetical protein
MTQGINRSHNFNYFLVFSIYAKSESIFKFDIGFKNYYLPSNLAGLILA